MRTYTIEYEIRQQMTPYQAGYPIGFIKELSELTPKAWAEQVLSKSFHPTLRAKIIVKEIRYEDS